MNFPTAEEQRQAAEMQQAQRTVVDEVSDEDRESVVRANEALVARRAAAQQTSSQYLGVWWSAHERVWRTQIRHNGVIEPLGTFHDEAAAARVHDAAARRLRGSDAHNWRDRRTRDCLLYTSPSPRD